MNAAGLMAVWEKVSDAPDAVGRLRRLIRDLGVTGRLVEGDAAPRALALARARSSSQGGPFQIPDPWLWMRADAVSDMRLGKMLDKAKNRGTACRYLRNVNVRWFDFELSDVSEMLLEDSEQVEFSLRSGDVLVCEGGEPGRAAVWEEREAGICFQKAIHRLRVHPDVDPWFLVHVLRQAADSGRLATSFTGTGIKHLTGKGLAAFLVPLPPLAEQQRIIAKLNELMGLCDQLEAARAEREARRDRLATASLARLNTPDPETFPADARFALDTLPALTTRPDQIKQLRQTILNLAIMGRLVPQEGDAPVSVPGLHGEATTGGVPRGWRLLQLRDLLLEDTRNGYSRRPDEAPEGVPILRISAGTVRRDGLVAEEEHKLISGIDALARHEYGLVAGDLLACRFNGNKAFVGRLTLFEDYLGLQPIYPDKLIRVRLHPDRAIPAFIRAAGESTIVRSEIEAFCAITVGNWGISASNLKEVRFPVPPIAEQRRIVAKVDELLDLCDRLEASLAAGADTRRALLEATLRDALAPVLDLADDVAA